MNEHHTHANYDAGIRNIKGWPVVGLYVNINKINYIAKPYSVNEIANGA